MKREDWVVAVETGIKQRIQDVQWDYIDTLELERYVDVMAPFLDPDMRGKYNGVEFDVEPHQLTAVFPFVNWRYELKIGLPVKSEPQGVNLVAPPESGLIEKKPYPTHTINVHGIEYDVNLGMMTDEIIMRSQYRDWINLTVCHEMFRIEGDTVHPYFVAETMRVRPTHISVIRPYRTGVNDD